MDIKAQYNKITEEIAILEKRMADDSFQLKVKKAQLKKWQKTLDDANALISPPTTAIE